MDWQVYGSRDLGARLPMEKDTIVRVYSMSKVISSVAVMILHEEGRLKLDDPVGKYLPALAKMKVFTGGSAQEAQAGRRDAPDDREGSADSHVRG